MRKFIKAEGHIVVDGNSELVEFFINVDHIIAFEDGAVIMSATPKAKNGAEIKDITISNENFKNLTE